MKYPTSQLFLFFNKMQRLINESAITIIDSVQGKVSKRCRNLLLSREEKFLKLFLTSVTFRGVGREAFVEYHNYGSAYKKVKTGEE